MLKKYFSLFLRILIFDVFFDKKGKYLLRKNLKKCIDSWIHFEIKH